jgi:nitrate reductase gamma subunit
MSPFLHFAEHRLQEAALVFMAIVYTARLVWLFRFKAGRDRQPRTGHQGTSPRAAGLYSIANVAMPWAMESTRRHPFFYLQFVLFHLAVVAAITLSFIIPYGPNLLAGTALARVFQVVIGLGCIVGIGRFVRRCAVPHMRAISTPDDFFSLALLTVWFAFGVLAAPNTVAGGEWHLLAFFVLTAFFLIYVPFSKISHYLYYPITRYYLGRTLGHRGVFPLRRAA